jgi:hypothetical protein
LLLWLVAAASNAADVRIHRAEPFALPAKALPDSATLRKDGARTPVAFEAFDRSFALELEDNGDLLSRLPAARRNAIAARAQLYSGRIQGNAQSWLRLTRVGSEVYGLIFDGQEFYSIAPRRTIESLLDPGAVAVTTGPNLIYRASDMDVDFGGSFCSAVRTDARTGRTTGAEAYDAVLAELATTAAAAGLPAREVEVGLLGDLEFYQRQGVDSEDALIASEDALIARFNIVDGIFSGQVDLRITIGSLQVFQSGNPFTTNDPEDLLDQLGSYRQSHSALQAFGLTHLVTGRTLNGTTIGIAYIESVCDPYFGSSLSEDMGFDVTLSALVAAHELGHNFGADHDNEPGSACASTPDGYLMAPRISGSSTFSQCSLDTMAPVIAAAPCIFAARVSDIAVTAVQSSVATTAGTPVTVEFDVEAAGTLAVDGVTVSVSDGSGGTDLQSATVAGGTCTKISNYFVCELGSVAAGSTRRIQLTASRDVADTVSIAARFEGIDDDPDNNLALVHVEVAPRVDVLVTGPASVPAILIGDSFTVNYIVTAQALDAAQNVIFQLYNGSGLPFVSATVAGGTCSRAGAYINCTLGTLAVGSSRSVSITLTGHFVGYCSLDAYVSATSDDVFDNNRTSTTCQVLARTDLRLTIEDPNPAGDVGDSATVTFEVTSTGIDPIAGVLDITIPRADADIQSVTADAAVCDAITVPHAWRCTFDPVEAGASRRAVVSVLGSELGSVEVRGLISSIADQDPNNNAAEASVRFEHHSDLYIAGSEASYAFDDRSFFMNVGAYSNGRFASTNTTFTIALPAGITPVSATPSAGTCTLQTDSIRCDVGTVELDVGARVDIELQAAAPGLYYGTANVTSDADGDAGNDQMTLQFQIDPAFDVALTLPTSVSAHANESIEVPVTLETSLHPIDSATVDIQISDSSIVVDSATTENGTCSISGTFITCAIDAMPASSTVTVALTVHGASLGTYYVYAEARTTPADIDPSNSYGQTSFSITATPSPPNTDSSGGGGGGGRLDLALLLALGVLTFSTQKRRRAA